MPTRSLNVVIAGDARPLETASKQASRSLDQVGSAHKKAAKATDEHISATGRLRTSFGSLYARGGEAIIAVAGLEGIKKGVESVVEAYKTQEVANSALKTQMKALNQSYSAHKDAIEEVVKRTSHLSGIAVPELTSTFTVLDRATGNVHKSLTLMGTAADVAAAKHISASRAAVLLGKVASGNVTAFNRYGLSIKAGTSATDALAQIQQRFAGQAKAYGDTAAGAGDKLRSSWEEVRATLGSKVAPAIAKVESGVANFITGMQEGTGAGGKFAKAISTAFEFVRSTIQTVVKAVRGYLTHHRQDINSVIDAVQKFGSGVKYVFQAVVLPVVKRTVGAIKPIIEGLADVVRGVVRVISGLLSGNWSRAWSGAKEVVSGAAKVIVTLVKTLAGDLLDIIKGLGPKLIRLIVKGLEGLGKAVATSIWDGIKSTGRIILNAAGWLKDQFVKAIKSVFGISSPSTVFEGFGTAMIEGLIKGLHPGAVVSFIKKVWGSTISKAVGGIAGAVSGVAGKVAGAVGGLFGGGKEGGGPRQWLTQALRITGQYTPSNYAALYRQMMSESGGNPRAINLTDINAQQGHPSKGLLQTIDSTFQAYRLRSLPNDIYNPVANTVAAIRYMLARYGHIVGTGHGYAAGTGGARPGFAWVGEKGPELVNFFGGEQVLSHSDSMHAGGMPGYAQGTLRKGRRSRTGHTGTAIEEAIALQHYLDRIHPSKGVLRDGSTADAGGIGGDAGDPNQPLIDAINAEAEAAKALADEMTGVRGELKANRDFATSVSNTSNYQLTKMLADLVSRQVGFGVVGRGFTPGTGVEVAY